jgi:hypothetical protein
MRIEPKQHSSVERVRHKNLAEQIAFLPVAHLINRNKNVAISKE